MAVGFVYVVGCHDMVKIGIAQNVKFRLSGLQTGNPYPLKLLASWRVFDVGRVEDQLHGLLENFKVRGEWFKVPPDILASILKIQNIEDLPP